MRRVIRYPWYTASLLGGAPYALTWLRYTAFYVLYPVGLLSEMWLLYSGLPGIAARQLHSVLLPNRWNWAFSYYAAMVVSRFAMLDVCTHETSSHIGMPVGAAQHRWAAAQ